LQALQRGIDAGFTHPAPVVPVSKGGWLDPDGRQWILPMRRMSPAGTGPLVMRGGRKRRSPPYDKRAAKCRLEVGICEGGGN